MGIRGFAYRDGGLFCEEVAVDRIVDELGSPAYIYSTAALAGNLRELSDAFGPDTIVCASVKACSTLAILNLYRRGGAGFDIVSGGEMVRALQAGARPKRIVFAGVGKTDAEIRDAIVADLLLLNVESEAELVNIDRLAGTLGRRADVALRLNPDVDGGAHAKTTTGRKENKFGIDLDTARRLVGRAADFPNVRFLGVDVHLGSPINSVQPYALALDKVARFVRQNRSAAAPLEYLDAGGGFGSPYRAEAVPAFASYARVLREAATGAGCTLIIEPGRSLAANAGVLVGEILYVKDTADKRFLVVDAGMNDLIRPAMYDSYHFCWPTRGGADGPPSALFAAAGRSDPVVAAYLAREEADAAVPVDREPDERGLVRADVVGPVCESSDRFAAGRRLPADLRRGDRLAVFSAGAYGFSMSSNYNSRPRAVEVLVDGDSFRVIRERETFADLVRGEVL